MERPFLMTMIQLSLCKFYNEMFGQFRKNEKKLTHSFQLFKKCFSYIIAYRYSFESHINKKNIVDTPKSNRNAVF